MYSKVPSLLSIVVKYIIEYEEINATLNPPEDWDNDTSHLYNQRMSRQEVIDFEIQMLSGKKSFSQIKSEMRILLQQRPFDLDLVQLQAIPFFNRLPDCIAKQIWIEAFLVSFEAQLPSFLWFKLEYGNKFDWNTLKCRLDRCENPELFEMLKEKEKELIVDDIVLEWLLENIAIDK